MENLKNPWKTPEKSVKKYGMQASGIQGRRKMKAAAARRKALPVSEALLLYHTIPHPSPSVPFPLQVPTKA